MSSSTDSAQEQPFTDQAPPPGRTSIASVVAGEHPDGVTVTVTGFANGLHLKKTKQDNPWAEFWLFDQTTAVRVQILPRPYRDYRHLFAYKDEDGTLRPAPLTITGRVAHGGPFTSLACPYQPQVIAERVAFAEGLVRHRRHAQGAGS
jgi:hypothetical protein